MFHELKYEHCYGLNVSPLSYLLQLLLKITASLSAALWLGVGHGDSSLWKPVRLLKRLATTLALCSLLLLPLSAMSEHVFSREPINKGP